MITLKIIRQPYQGSDLEQLRDMLLFDKPELVPLTIPTPAPLVLISIVAPHLWALSAQRRSPTTNARAASRTCIGAASLPEHQAKPPAGTHARACDGRGAKVGLVGAGHLRRAEGRCCREGGRGCW